MESNVVRSALTMPLSLKELDMGDKMRDGIAVTVEVGLNWMSRERAALILGRWYRSPQSPMASI
jgi:hypothetical protein